MSLTPTVYKSTDQGAPLLSGQPGALVALLDVLLVDGYGTGADRKAGMGWTKAFSGANVRAYRNNVITGTGFYLRVNDAAARSAFVRGYSAMTDIDSGADPTPMESMRAGGSRWEKSFVATGEGRAWTAIGNERFFYLFIDTAGLFATYAGAAMTPHYAGDIASIKTGDRHHFVVSNKGSDAEQSSSIGYALKAAGGWNVTPNSDALTACFIARSSGGNVGTTRCFLSADGQYTGGGFGLNTAFPAYPYPLNNGLLYSPIAVFEGYMAPRGFLPGLYAPMHRRPFPEMTVISDVAGLPAGSQLLAKGYMLDTTGYSESYASQVLIDITNEW